MARLGWRATRESVARNLNSNERVRPIGRTLLLYIEGNPQHTKTLVERFRKYPKPMYYQPAFLEKIWAEYKNLKKIRNDDDVVPDDFAVWGFEQLLHHRIPIYQKIAKNFGYQIPMEDVPKIKSETDFLNLLGAVIDRH